MKRCPLTAIWPEIPPHGVRLHCVREAGHQGDCAADTENIEYLPAPSKADAEQVMP